MTKFKSVLASVAALSTWGAAGTGIVCATAASTAWAAPSESAVGTWRTPTKHGEVEITKCGASLCGRLVESDGLRANPGLRDIKNKDASKQNRLIKDLQILGGFRMEGNKWVDGTIYNPEDGGTYKATITFAGKDTLKLKGCIVWPLCKTQTWTRIR